MPARTFGQVSALQTRHAETHSSRTSAMQVMVGAVTCHPNVVTVYSASTLRCGPGEETQDGLQTTLVLEHCDRGSLDSLAPTIWRIMEEDKERAFRITVSCLLDVVSGLEYLHSLGVVHGDLKCQNILCKSGSNSRGFFCKVSDFGLSRIVRAEDVETPTEQTGTILYAAPEVLRNGSIRLKSDVYSFGVIAWHLITPGSFDIGMNDAQICYQVIEHGWRPQIPSTSGSFGAIRGLIERCWSAECDARPCFRTIREELTGYAWVASVQCGDTGQRL